MSKVVLENVGPVKSFEFEVPEDGGVVVLRGRNGAGKSHILDAVQSLVSGDGSVPLRDGQSKGRVEGLGATIKFAKRTTRSGALEVESLTGDVAPATLVDPGIDNPERADAARIKALLTLAGVQASARDFIHNGERIDLPEHETDPVKLSGLAAREYQRLAREQEAKVAELESELAGLGTVEVDYDGETDPDKLEEALIDAKAKLQSLHEWKAQAVRAQSMYDKAQADLAQASGDIEQRLAAAAVTQQSAQIMYETRCQEVADAKEALARLEEECTKAHMIAIDSKRRHEELTQEAQRFAALKATVDAGAPVGVDAEQIDAANKAVLDCRANMDRAALVRKNAETEEARDGIASELQIAQGHAERLRSYVGRCEQTLSAMVGKSGTGLFVEGGRLRIATDRGPDELFGELSHGERWKAAIDVCVSSVGNKALIVIPQEAWEGIDPANRTELAEHARANRVTILTAECGNGPIEAEQL